MNTWKTPALLGTIGLMGLGSLFAQVPALPAPSFPEVTQEPTLVEAPISSGSATVIHEVPVGTGIMDSMPMDSMPMDSMPVEMGTHYGPSPEMMSHESSPAGGCSTCGQTHVASTPCPMATVAAECDVAPCAMLAPIAESCSTCNAPAPQPVYMPAPVSASQPSCGCQGGAGYSHGGYGQAGYYGVSGSGSGVASGVLSPNANSGGLHTRHPYYNYRHPWFYQGPPSQNVTIVW